jgi:hypothetical protein
VTDTTLPGGPDDDRTLPLDRGPRVMRARTRMSAPSSAPTAWCAASAQGGMGDVYEAEQSEPIQAGASR